MKLILHDERNGVTNQILNNIVDCVNFWNREGKFIWMENIYGDLGNEDTNKIAQTLNYDDWVLEMMACDANIFCTGSASKESLNGFESGRTRSHVWVHMNGVRVLMFSVDMKEKAGEDWYTEKVIPHLTKCMNESEDEKDKWLKRLEKAQEKNRELELRMQKSIFAG